MAYKFVEKRNTVQEEMAYIVYMIVGSYFNKAICKNPMMAGRLYLYYMEMRKKIQEEKEQEIIMQTEQTLKAYEHVFGEMNCEVVIRFMDDKYILDFITGFELIHAEVDRKGNCGMRISLNN